MDTNKKMCEQEWSQKKKSICNIELSREKSNLVKESNL